MPLLELWRSRRGRLSWLTMLKELQVLTGAARDKQHCDGKQKSKFISGKICAMLILTFPSLVEEVSTSYKADEDKAPLSQ